MENDEKNFRAGLFIAILSKYRRKFRNYDSLDNYRYSKNYLRSYDRRDLQ